MSHNRKHIIAPSMLAADFARIKEEVEMINESEADWFHIDIMDGVFVPNISFGFPVLEAIQRYAKKPLDVHLMIEQPERYFSEFKKYGADRITIHYEGATHLHRSIAEIKKLGCAAGVALNPHTPVLLLKDILADIDQVCVMSVNPGFGGQSFILQTYAKVRALREMAIEVNPDLIIEVDGGVSTANAGQLLQVGADALVAGSFVFSSEDPLSTIHQLKSIDPGVHRI